MLPLLASSTEPERICTGYPGYSVPYVKRWATLPSVACSSSCSHRTTMSPSAYVTPIVDSTSIFKPDIFKGKVLFCTGGGSGICRAMTEAVVCIAS